MGHASGVRGSGGNGEPFLGAYGKIPAIPVRGSVGIDFLLFTHLEGHHHPLVCSICASANAETAKPFIELGTSSETSSNTLGSA